MKKGIVVAVAIGAIVALAAANVSASDGNLVVNGGFEMPVVTAPQGWDIYDSGSGGLGWTVEWRSDVPASWGGWTRPDPAHLELHRGVNNWASHSGYQHAELDTDWNDHLGTLNNEPASVRIYQDLATCPGETYTLQYYWSPRPGHADNAIAVSWGGLNIANHSGPGGGNTIWNPETRILTASSEWTALAFVEAANNDSLGMFLDDVSVVGPTHPCVIEVTIDIKPGSDPNCFNNDGHGVIPVAILGSETFDVTSIDPASVQLEGLAVRMVGKSDKLLAHIEDVNGDGFYDLVVQIADVDGVWTAGTTLATVTGSLWDGTPIEGQDYVCITQ